MSTSTLQERTYSCPAGDIHYWISHPEQARADRPPLVFCHGMTADHHLFDAQLSHFAAEHILLAWDAPAHGLSRPWRSFSYDAAAECLYAIMQQEQLSKALLIGQSMGAYITQVFAIKHSDSVLAMVCVDSTPLGHAYYSRSVRRLLPHVSSLAAAYPTRLLRYAIAKNATFTPSSYQYMHHTLQQLSKAEICRLMKVCYSDFLRYEKTAQFDFPLLLVMGQHDKTGLVKKYMYDWAWQADLSMAVLPDAAHNSNADNPDAFNEVLTRFLCDLAAPPNLSFI